MDEYGVSRKNNGSFSSSLSKSFEILSQVQNRLLTGSMSPWTNWGCDACVQDIILALNCSVTDLIPNPVTCLCDYCFVHKNTLVSAS